MENDKEENDYCWTVVSKDDKQMDDDEIVFLLCQLIDK
jgi:hypothetical protein